MSLDWESMDEVNASEAILGAALAVEAREICFTSDDRGASVFFLTENSLESYDHLPLVLWQKVRHYFKQMASIDVFKEPPQRGFSMIKVDGMDCTLTVSTNKGPIFEDLTVSLLLF